MNPDWKAFLGDTARFTEIQNTQNQKEMPLQQGMLLDLSHRGLIKVSGEDAESFLQNQFSNDIRNVTDTTHQASAWCNPKGRIIANFRIFKRDNSFYLSLSADLLALVLKKLQMYVMMSKVTLEDISDSLIHFGFVGTLPLDNPPSEKNQTLQHNNLSILYIDSINNSTPRYEILGELSYAQQLWEQCASDATVVSSTAWDYFNIQAGQPEISADSSEAWIPQMVNFIAVDGVDFKKGCYPGQEVVARLNYLGKTKRRLYRLLIDTDQLPAIGDAISSDSDKDAGKILNAAINPEGKVEALTVMKIAEVEKTLALASNDKTAISVLDLPYSLDDV